MNREAQIQEELKRYEAFLRSSPSICPTLQDVLLYAVEGTEVHGPFEFECNVTIEYSVLRGGMVHPNITLAWDDGGPRDPNRIKRLSHVTKCVKVPRDEYIIVVCDKTMQKHWPNANGYWYSDKNVFGVFNSHDGFLRILKRIH